MNVAERFVDRSVPEIGVYLRLMKKRLQSDITLRVIEALVRPRDVVVDVGAYRGVYTLKLARTVGSRGRVWAVEPLPDNVAALRRIWSARRSRPFRSPVTLLPYGVSEAPSEAEFHLPIVDGRPVRSHGSVGALDVPSESVAVTLRTLDELVSPMTTSVSFVKIDVEGHEHEALLGAERILTNDKPSIFIEIEQRHRERPISETFELLRDYGYTGYFSLDGRLHPIEQFDLDIHQPVSMRGFSAGEMPDQYVHDFLFTRAWADRSVDHLLA